MGLGVALLMLRRSLHSVRLVARRFLRAHY